MRGALEGAAPAAAPRSQSADRRTGRFASGSLPVARYHFDLTAKLLASDPERTRIPAGEDDALRRDSNSSTGLSDATPNELALDSAISARR